MKYQKALCAASIEAAAAGQAFVCRSRTPNYFVTAAPPKRSDMVATTVTAFDGGVVIEGGPATEGWPLSSPDPRQLAFIWR